MIFDQVKNLKSYCYSILKEIYRHYKQNTGHRGVDRMEGYENFDADVFDAPDAPNTPNVTTNDGAKENEFISQNRQMIRQPEFGIEGKLGGNPRVLRATSGNGAKRQATTRAGKPAEAAVKQLATKELQIEKGQIERGRIQGWKQMVMTEVALDLQGIKRAYAEAMEIQGQSFQLELERVKEKLELIESKSALLEQELRLLKNRKPTLEKELVESAHASNSRQESANDKSVESSYHRLSSSAPADGITAMTQSSSKVIKRVQSTKPAPKNYAQIAESNATQSKSNIS